MALLLPSLTALSAALVLVTGCPRTEEAPTPSEKKVPITERAAPPPSPVDVDKKQPDTADGRPVEEQPRVYWAAEQTGAIDLVRFDVLAFLPLARKAAVAHSKDAELFRILWLAVDPKDGTSEVTAAQIQRNNTAGYAFRSATAPAEGEKDCSHWIYVDEKGVYEEDSCSFEIPERTERTETKPNCDVVEIIAKLGKANREPVGRVSLYWTVRMPDSGAAWTVPDFTTQAGDHTVSQSVSTLDVCGK